MTSVSSRSVAALSGPGDVVATIPSLCGFLPRDSVVVLSLRGPRRRIGLTVRLDLPGPAAEADVAQMLAERVAQDGGAAAVVVVYGRARRQALVAQVTAALEQRGIGVAESLHVDDGRWTSYACRRPCCPAEGTPVPAAPALVEAQRALEGRVVLSSREELVRSMAPPAFLQARERLQALQQAERAWLVRLDQLGEQATGAEVLRQARVALDQAAQGRCLAAETAALLAVGLHDVRVRDEVATWSLTRSDALLSVLEQLVRLTPAPYDAPACTLLAWVAYARGDGSRANVALDRALSTDGTYSLALLLRAALDGGVPPHDVRRVLRGTRRALRP